MPSFRVSYSFTDQLAGDEHAIRKALRDLSFAAAFDPEDLNHWRVRRTEDGGYLLLAHRTLVAVIDAPSERAALRGFLYGIDLPDRLDLAQLHIEQLPAKPGAGAGEEDGEQPEGEAA
jgi:hypothetical protein